MSFINNVKQSIKNNQPIVAYSKGLNKATGDVKDFLTRNNLIDEVNPYTFYQEYGVHRSHKYNLEMNVPTAVVKQLQAIKDISLSASDINKRLDLLCTSITIPAKSIATTTVHVGGEVIRVPSNIEYDQQCTLEFYIDGGYEGNGGVSINVFNTWLESIFSPYSRTFAYPNDYKSKIGIKLFTTPDGTEILQKENIGEIFLHEAYPTSIQPVMLQGQSTDPTKITVTFTYRYMTTVDLSGDSSAWQTITKSIKSGFRLVRFGQEYVNSLKTTVTSVKSAVKNLF